MTTTSGPALSPETEQKPVEPSSIKRRPVRKRKKAQITRQTQLLRLPHRHLTVCRKTLRAAGERSDGGAAADHEGPSCRPAACQGSPGSLPYGLDCRSQNPFFCVKQLLPNVFPLRKFPQIFSFRFFSGWRLMGYVLLV